MRSLTSNEIAKRAIDGIQITKDEILAIYGDPNNWQSTYELHDGRCCWIWIGPIICPYEAAQWVMKK